MIKIEDQPNNICTVGHLNIVIFISTTEEYNDLHFALAETGKRYGSLTPCFHRLPEDHRRDGRYYLDYHYKNEGKVYAALMAAAETLEDKRSEQRHPPMKIIVNGQERRTGRW